MKQKVIKQDVSNSKTSVKEMFIISSVSVLCTIGVYKAVQYFKPKPNNQSAKSGTNYVFFSTEG